MGHIGFIRAFLAKQLPAAAAAGNYTNKKLWDWTRTVWLQTMKPKTLTPRRHMSRRATSVLFQKVIWSNDSKILISAASTRINDFVQINWLQLTRSWTKPVNINIPHCCFFSSSTVKNIKWHHAFLFLRAERNVRISKILVESEPEGENDSFHWFRLIL